MALFHQSSPQLSSHLKAFPGRLNDVQLTNTSRTAEVPDYFGEYGETLNNVSIVAFLPIIIIAVLLAILLMLFKMKTLRTNRSQLDQLEEIYRILETVDQVAAGSYAVNSKLINEIRYALVLNENNSSCFASNRRASLYATKLDKKTLNEDAIVSNNYHYFQSTLDDGQNKLVWSSHSKGESELDKSQIV